MGQNDDWYWMYATVHEHISERPHQKDSRGQKRKPLKSLSSSLSSSPTVVITNDHMRDHRLSLLEPRPFSRWRASQVIRYRFLYDYFDDNDTNGHSSSNSSSIINLRNNSNTNSVRSSSNNKSDNENNNKATLPTSPIFAPKKNNSAELFDDAKPLLEEENHSSNHIVGINFFKTASFSREIHRSNFAIDNGIKKEIHKNKIHIPCEEQNIWLCIDLEQIEGKGNPF